MHRPVRALAALAGVGAAAGLLVGCGTKPTPNVTVLTGSTTAVVRPQTYCFDASGGHCRVSPSGNVGSIRARAGSTVFIDVPRAVARSHWTATSATQAADGQFQTITGSGLSSGTLHDTHSTRLTVPYGVGNQYYVIVIEQNGQVQTGSWVTLVTITD
jgi:hypothetical protein